MTFSKNLLDRFGNSHLATLSDAELLRAYAVTRDDDSFRVLIERHGPMVLRVCRTVLRDADAADDAFQATFLVLSRKAGRVANTRPGAVAGWLYLTARRVALKARTALARRQRRDAAAATPVVQHSPDDVSARELLAVLDEELEAMPARYRLPLLLCFW
jgi:RNA polymerase sigma factor (sigma-70 family)